MHNAFFQVHLCVGAGARITDVESASGRLVDRASETAIADAEISAIQGKTLVVETNEFPGR